MAAAALEADVMPPISRSEEEEENQQSITQPQAPREIPIRPPSEKRKRGEEEEEEEEENPPRGGGEHEEEEEEIRVASDSNQRLWKTSLCCYFRRELGSCSHGDTCSYAHGEAELRPRPDSSWDPTSQRAKKLLLESDGIRGGGGDVGESATVPEKMEAGASLDKCLVGLPRKWASDKLKSFLDTEGIIYRTAKKKKGITVGFVGFANADQVGSAIKELNGKSMGKNSIKVADAFPRTHDKKSKLDASLDQTKVQPSESHSGGVGLTLPISSNAMDGDDSVSKDCGAAEGLVSKTRIVRDVVTPLAHMPYNEQLEDKKNSLIQHLKKLTRNARKACPESVLLPDWIFKSKDIGGLSCKFEGILESPLKNGYRNKCEFSVGYSLQGKRTVGFMLGNFREGMTAVEEPVDCPNISSISCKYALIFQEFLQSSVLPVWNRNDNTGFWRQLTVREGRNPDHTSVVDDYEARIAEVMLIIQICSSCVDEELMGSELQKMSQALAQGASACSPPLPLTALVVQDHKGISNAAPADCPLHPLPLPMAEKLSGPENKVLTEARIHDYIGNLRFCISPTAFFQVNTLAAEKLYSLAGDWADLSSDTLLFDICCGTGTIGLTLAHRVGMVVGIEMNDSAVADARRNAEINGIKNCTFVCAKAEDVMGTLLKDYLDEPQQHDTTSDAYKSNSKVTNGKGINDAPNDGTPDSVACTSLDVLHFNGESYTDNNQESSDNAFLQGESLKLQANGCNAPSGIPENLSTECREASQESCTKEYKKETNAVAMNEFKHVVVIVDPPRVGLHPVVTKSLRINPRIRRLVYISCNPESLVANAIELCTPTCDKPEKGKNNSRGWRNMSSAGLARHRAKSMPNSEPFRPVKAVAVDLFPHTPHCEMVMLLER